jgi:hypothetical protein
LPEWISFDDDERKVTIVGKGSYQIEDGDAYKIFHEIALAGVDWIRSNQILQNAFGGKTGGANKVCQLLKKLPQQLQDLIDWKEGTKGGRRLSATKKK